jgi:hypothetical protein
LYQGRGITPAEFALIADFLCWALHHFGATVLITDDIFINVRPQ